MFTARFQAWVRRTASRAVLLLHMTRLTPNVLTVMGLAITLVAAVLIGLGQLLPAGLVLVVASAFDILDGALARVTGRTQRYGAFLDSTTDRYAEAFTYIALLYYFIVREHATLQPMLVVVALAGSLLVSYVRARAQSLGFSCDGGLLARPERVVITVVGLVIAPFLVWALWILAVLTNLTALQRVWLVWRQARPAPPRGPERAASVEHAAGEQPPPVARGSVAAEPQ